MRKVKKKTKNKKPGNNLTKEVKDLYAENSKTLIKEIEDGSPQMERYPMLLDWNK